MEVLKSYAKGISEAAKQPKMMVVLWAINFIFGAVIYFLCYTLFSHAWGRSIVADDLINKFDANSFFELIAHYGEHLKMIFLVTLLLIMGYFIFSLFIHGGIIFTLLEDKNKNNNLGGGGTFASTFFYGAGKFFGRFFRLLIYSLILWGIFIVLNILFNLIGNVLTVNGTREEIVIYLFWIRVVITLFLVYLIRMILDYARIEIVVRDSHGVFQPFLKMIKFVFQKIGKTLALYYLLLLTGAVLFVLGWVVNSRNTGTTALSIVMIFLISQIFLALRMWLKIAFQAGQIELHALEHPRNEYPLPKATWH